jgi:hypothetical protein
MPALKNIRHELFLREYLKTGIAAEAYRRVYPNHTGNSARVSASKVLSKANIKRRLAELRGRVMKRSDVTIERILEEYEDARKLAIEQEKPSEMLAASEKKAKLVGLLVDRREVGNAGEFDAMNEPSAILEKVAEEAGPEAAMALAKAFGLMDDQAIEKAKLLDSDSPSDAVN